jgi:hypothetical protein
VHNEHIKSDNEFNEKPADLQFDPTRFLKYNKTFKTTVDEKEFNTEEEAFSHLDTLPKIYQYFRQFFNEYVEGFSKEVEEEAEGGAAKEEAIIKKPENKLEAMFSIIPHSDKAITIVKNLPTLTVMSLGDLRDEFVTLTSHVTKDNSDNLLRKITEQLLWGYQDLEKASKKAIETCF